MLVVTLNQALTRLFAPVYTIDALCKVKDNVAHRSIPASDVDFPPNGWEGVSQQVYRRAIERVDLVPSTTEGRSRVHMLSEGEAIFHFCMESLSKAETTNQAGPQGVVVIDAGAETIELSVFAVTSNPITCEEIAPSERLQLLLTAEFLLTQ